MKLLKCEVCDTEFEPRKENRYTANATGAFLGGNIEKDCFDCPVCGCQIVAGTRYSKSINWGISIKPADEKSEEETNE